MNEAAARALHPEEERLPAMTVERHIEHVPADTPARVQTIAHTAAALFSVQAITWLRALIAALVYPRLFGADSLGRLLGAETTVALLVAIAAFGSASYITKDVARSPEMSAATMLSAIVVRLGILATGSALLLAGAILSGADSATVTLLLVMLVGGAFATVSEALAAALQGHQRLAPLALASGIIGIFGTCAAIAVAFATRDILLVAAMSVVTAGVTTAAATFLAVRATRGPRSITFSRVRELVSGASPFFAWSLAQMMLARIDFLMLAVLAGSVAVGNYGVAWRLAAMPIFVPTIITTAVFPALAAASNTDRDWFKRLLTEAARYTLLATVPMGVGLAVVAHDFLPLISGDGFGAAPAVMIALAIGIPLVAADTVLGTGLFALDRQRIWAGIAWCAAILNILANFIAIPAADRWFGNPALGAAVVTVGTEVLMAAAALILLGSQVDRRRLLRSGSAIVGISCAMGAAVVLLIPYVGSLAAIPIGALVYVVLALVFGVVSRAELRAGLAYLPGRGGRP